MSFSLIYVTFADETSAHQISRQLIDEGLIACANVFPIESMYWWKGSVAEENECVSLLKTTNAHWPKVHQRLQEIHPYDVPCIMRMSVEANRDYEEWIAAEVTSR